MTNSNANTWYPVYIANIINGLIALNRERANPVQQGRPLCLTSHSYVSSNRIASSLSAQIKIFSIWVISRASERQRVD